MKDKPLTEKGLINGLVDFWEQVAWPAIEDKFRAERKKTDEQFEAVRGQFKIVNRKIDSLKADVADTPSRKEFSGLKRKVLRHHPTI